jgi:mRNA interferase MazF
MSSSTNKPKHGEIWRISFDPTVGAEIKKTRMAIVISLDSIGRLPLRIVVPITEWDERYSSSPWMVRLDPNIGNGLVKSSAVDCFQVKSVSLDRFMHKAGVVTMPELEEIKCAVQICIGAT